MLFKIYLYTSGVIVFGCLLSEKFAKKIDRNLMRPVWDFVVVLNDRESFFMPDDVKKLFKELNQGVKNLLKFERDI